MAIDSLQEKIRKSKSALMVDLSAAMQDLPEAFLQNAEDESSAVLEYCREIMSSLKGIVPALRFRFSSFSLLSGNGLKVLSQLLRKADSMGFYVLVDAPEITDASMAERIAAAFWQDGSSYPCDGLLISCYPGSDAIRPFVPYCREQRKDLFVQVRTANKSAAELQDLLAGSRMVHAAAADYVNRFGKDTIGKYGYSRIAVAASATSADSLRNLRMKYPGLFILADGLDCTGANAKNCSAAFDKMGHGATACVSGAVLRAWQGQEGSDAGTAAKAAAEKFQKNLLRYITIL